MNKFPILNFDKPCKYLHAHFKIRAYVLVDLLDKTLDIKSLSIRICIFVNHFLFVDVIFVGYHHHHHHHVRPRLSIKHRSLKLKINNHASKASLPNNKVTISPVLKIKAHNPTNIRFAFCIYHIVSKPLLHISATTTTTTTTNTDAAVFNHIHINVNL